MCEYGFEEGRDFYSKLSKTSEAGGRPQTDYDIKIDMAKEICMIQRTPEGKKVREYLISLEKAWNTPELIMARALKMADRQITDLKEDNAKLIEENKELAEENTRFVEEIETMQPQIDYLELICKSPERLNATQIAAEYGMQADKFNKILHEIGFIKKTNDTWVPTAKIADKGYMVTSTFVYDKENHKTRTRFAWNQEGRKAIYFELAKKGIYPMKERNQRYIQMTLDI